MANNRKTDDVSDILSPLVDDQRRARSEVLDMLTNWHQTGHAEEASTGSMGRRPDSFPAELRVEPRSTQNRRATIESFSAETVRALTTGLRQAAEDALEFDDEPEEEPERIVLANPQRHIIRRKPKPSE